MAARDDLIHLCLRIAATRLKILDQPAENSEPFLALSRNAEQPAGDVNEVLENATVVALGLSHRTLFSDGLLAAAPSRFSCAGVGPVECGDRWRVSPRSRASHLLDLPLQRRVDRWPRRKQCRRCIARQL